MKQEVDDKQLQVNHHNHNKNRTSSNNAAVKTNWKCWLETGGQGQNRQSHKVSLWKGHFSSSLEDDNRSNQSLGDVEEELFKQKTKQVEKP